METLSRHSIRIVHVEDDSDFAGISKLLLRKAGFDQPVVHCKNGVDALRYFSTVGTQQSPHVILLDLHMPQLGGLEVLHWLRHGHAMPDIPVYLLTSSDDAEDRRKAAANRATGYILKTPVFGEVIQNLDNQIATINHRNFHGISATQKPPDEPFAPVGEDLYFEDEVPAPFNTPNR